MAARVLVRIPQIGASRQVDAINLLCGLSPLAPQANKLLLNQSRGARTTQDPLAILDTHHEKFSRELSNIMEKISWSKDQIECLKACTSFPDGALLIQGFPGGKTFLLAGMAFIL